MFISLKSSIITAIVINKASSGRMLLEMIKKCYISEILFHALMSQNSTSATLLTMTKSFHFRLRFQMLVVFVLFPSAIHAY